MELLHVQNDITFIVVPPFSPFVCKPARVAVLASCGSDAILSHKQKVEVQMCTSYCTCAVHM